MGGVNIDFKMWNLYVARKAGAPCNPCSCKWPQGCCLCEERAIAGAARITDHIRSIILAEKIPSS